MSPREGYWISFLKALGVGVLLVVVAPELQGEEPDEVDNHNADGYAANDEFAGFKTIF